MSKAYGKTPSEVLEVGGATGYFLDTGIFVFGRWVENEIRAAERSNSNEMFARSAAARAFARCMGDDMSKSTAGFANPFTTGVVKSASGKDIDEATGDEILWAEG